MSGKYALHWHQIIKSGYVQVTPYMRRTTHKHISEFAKMANSGEIRVGVVGQPATRS